MNEPKNQINRIELASAGVGLLLIFALFALALPGVTREGGPVGKPSAAALAKRGCKSGSWLGRNVPRSPARCADPRRLQVNV